MSKKHFEGLAKSLKATYPREMGADGDIKVRQWREMVLAVTEFCASQNANFSRSRFLTACGIYE